MTGPAKPEQLGTQLARLHLHNIEKVYASDESCSFVGATRKNPPPIRQFGFHITTYSGYMPLINEWSENWVKYGDRQVLSLWPMLERKIPNYFVGCQIVPSLLHGDLWSGNYSYDDNGPGSEFNSLIYSR
uniref:protein-ribulosamine 3-kinase n=1 Tax=Ascaris lumbricoides TaxID=6252 RepID=A0A0M3HGS4_ASCLU